MSEKNLIIYGGTALSMNAQLDVFTDCVLEIKDGSIVSLKSDPSYTPPQGACAINAKNQIVMPGFINGHTHLGMGLLRGLAEDLPLERWLHEIIFPMESKWGSPEFVDIGTKLSCTELVKSGTTTFNDMYFYEEHTAKAANEVGVRGICAQAVIEIHDVPNPVEQLITGFDKFLSEIKPYPLMTPAIGPHSVYGVSEAVFKEVMDYSKAHKIPIHLHLSETLIEVNGCIEKYGKRPPAYCESIGLFDQPCIAAHATVLTEEDIKILGRNKVGCVHNPESNLKLGTTISPVMKLRNEGCFVSIGTDSVASNNNLDLLEEIDMATKLQAHSEFPGALTVKDAVKMLTIEGAKAVGLADTIGSLEVGKRADVICIDTNHVRATPLYDPYAYLVFSANGNDVCHTIVDGQVIMKDRKMQLIDEDKLLDSAREWGDKIQTSLKEATK